MGDTSQELRSLSDEIKSVRESLIVLRTEYEMTSDDIKRNGQLSRENALKLESIKERINALRERQDQIESIRDKGMKNDQNGILITALKLLLDARSVWIILAAGLVLILGYFVIVQDGLTKILDLL